MPAIIAAIPLDTLPTKCAWFIPSSTKARQQIQGHGTIGRRKLMPHPEGSGRNCLAGTGARQQCSRIILDGRVGHRDRRVAVHGYAVVDRVPGTADIVRYGGAVDDDVAGVVIGDKEDGRAVCIDSVVLDERAENSQRHRVAVIIDGPPAAAARRAGLCRIGAVADGAVVGKQAVPLFSKA